MFCPVATAPGTDFEAQGPNEPMSQSTNDQSLRDHVLYVLRGEGAHITFDDFVADFPVARCGESVPGLPYTAWQVLEHMRLALWDILKFSRDAKIGRAHV